VLCALPAHPRGKIVLSHFALFFSVPFWVPEFSTAFFFSFCCRVVSLVTMALKGRRCQGVCSSPDRSSGRFSLTFFFSVGRLQQASFSEGEFRKRPVRSHPSPLSWCTSCGSVFLVLTFEQVFSKKLCLELRFFKVFPLSTILVSFSLEILLWRQLPFHTFFPVGEVRFP